MIKVGDTLPAVTLAEYSEVEGNGCSIGPNPVDITKAAAGKTAAEATPEERLAAYARVATESAGSAELALILEFSKHAGLAAQWDGVVARWTPTAEEAATDPRAFAMFIARLAADGLWSFESMYDTRLNPQFRSAVAEAIAAMIPATTSP